MSRNTNVHDYSPMIYNMSNQSEKMSSHSYVQVNSSDSETDLKSKQLQKKLEEMQITLNEKEAEIIRLTICLGDEKLRDSTPSRKRSSTSSSVNNYQNNSDIVRNMMIMDSPYFRSTMQLAP
jgi:hypothetical protein